MVLCAGTNNADCYMPTLCKQRDALASVALRVLVTIVWWHSDYSCMHPAAAADMMQAGGMAATLPVKRTREDMYSSEPDDDFGWQHTRGCNRFISHASGMIRICSQTYLHFYAGTSIYERAFPPVVADQHNVTSLTPKLVCGDSVDLLHLQP